MVGKPWHLVALVLSIVLAYTYTSNLRATVPLPTEQKALFLSGPKGRFVTRNTTVPSPGAGEILVEIHATALNPVDWKIKAYNFLIEEYPAILGTDAAGIVKAVGKGVKNFKVGDRVLHQGYFDNRHATFQQYTVVPAEIAAKLPPKLTFEQGASFPLAMGTAACGLYNKRQESPGGAGLYPPWEQGGRGKYAGQPILIIGGSSSVGQQAVQFAKLSGFSPIITIASRRNELRLRSRGATHVIDRSVPLSRLQNTIREITDKPLEIAYDAIADYNTQNAAYGALANGGKLILTLDAAIEQEKLTADKTIVNVFGNVHVPTQREVGVGLYRNLTAMLEAGDLKPNEVQVVRGGLGGIPGGLERLKRGGISFLKLVVFPQDGTEQHN